MRRDSTVPANTVGIVGTSLLIGLVLQKVEVVFGFTGAVASMVLSYCLPAAVPRSTYGSARTRRARCGAPGAPRPSCSPAACSG